MTQSSELLLALKRAANFSKLAMHNEGPRCFKRGQGALMKVVLKFGDGDKGISVKKLARTLGWGRHETMSVAHQAAENGYVTVQRKASGKRRVMLTPLGNEIMQKRMAAEDRAADEVFAYLTDDEREQLLALCTKVSDAVEDMGIDYSEIEEKKRGRRHGHRRHFGPRGKGGKKDCKLDEAEALEAPAAEPAEAAEAPTEATDSQE